MTRITLANLDAVHQLQQQTATGGQGSQLLSRLTAGEIVRAQVVRELGDGLFALNIRGASVVSASTIPLSPGQVITAQVNSNPDTGQISLHALTIGEDAVAAAEQRPVLAGLESERPTDQVADLLSRPATTAGQGTAPERLAASNPNLAELSAPQAATAPAPAAVTKTALLQSDGPLGRLLGERPDLTPRIESLFRLIESRPEGIGKNLESLFNDIGRLADSMSRSQRADLAATVSRLADQVLGSKVLDDPRLLVQAFSERLAGLAQGFEGSVSSKPAPPIVLTASPAASHFAAGTAPTRPIPTTVSAPSAGPVPSASATPLGTMTVISAASSLATPAPPAAPASAAPSVAAPTPTIPTASVATAAPPTGNFALPVVTAEARPTIPPRAPPVEPGAASSRLLNPTELAPAPSPSTPSSAEAAPAPPENAAEAASVIRSLAVQLSETFGRSSAPLSTEGRTELARQFQGLIANQPQAEIASSVKLLAGELRSITQNVEHQDAAKRLTQLADGLERIAGQNRVMPDELLRAASTADSTSNSQTARVQSAVERAAGALPAPGFSTPSDRSLAQDMAGIRPGGADLAALPSKEAVTAAFEQDLKGQLLELRSQLGEISSQRAAPAPVVQHALNHVDVLLDQVSAQQVRNLDGMNHFMYVELPMDPRTGIDEARLHVFRRPRPASARGADPDQLTVAVFLNMSQLGDVLAVVSSVDSAVTVGFTVENADVERALSAEIEGLRDSLMKSGQLGATVTVRQARPGRADEISPDDEIWSLFLDRFPSAGGAGSRLDAKA